MPDETAHLTAALEAFRDRSLVADDGYVVIKGGKEATVFRCRAGARASTEFLAAKAYRALEVRRFKNDAIYQEGRVILDSRLRRAYAKKTRRGHGVQFGLWVSHEYDVLKTLHAAGADVPRPVARSGDTILCGPAREPERADAPDTRLGPRVRLLCALRHHSECDRLGDRTMGAVPARGALRNGTR